MRTTPRSTRPAARRGRPAPRRLAEAIALACASGLLAGAPAQAADRYWSFAAGCSSADLTSFCWRASPGGAAGAAPPGAGDSVFILQNAATELTVRAINAASTALPKYQSLVLDGSGAAPAGLRLERGALSAINAVVGDSGRGHLTQTGGIAVLDGLTLGYSGTGRYDLQGGELRTQGLAVGLVGTGDLVQTGGLLVVTGLLGINKGSTLRTSGGTLDLRGVTGYLQYPKPEFLETPPYLYTGTLHLAGGTVLTNDGQTLRANTLLATAGSGEMLRNTVLEYDELMLSGVGRTIELDAQLRGYRRTTVLASAADEQVTVNLRGQGSTLGDVLVGTEIDGSGTGRGVLQLLAGARADAFGVAVGNRNGGQGQVRVSGAGSRLGAASVSIGVDFAQDQPFSLLMVDQGGAIETASMSINDNGAAQVMSGGGIGVSGTLTLLTQSNRLPSLLISDGGVVSAGTTILYPRTTLGLTGPSSTLATRTLVNNGTTFFDGVGARITGLGGVGTPLDVTNGGLLDVRQGADAHVAGAVLNNAGATVSVGSFAALRMGSYTGAGALNIGNGLDAAGNGGAKVVIDGATQVLAGGSVQVGSGSTLRMGSYSGAGTLGIGSGARLEVDGDVTNGGLLDVRQGADAHVAGAVLNNAGATVSVGPDALLRMSSYGGAGALNIGSRAKVTVDGAVQVLPGGGVLVSGTGASLRAASYSVSGSMVSISGEIVTSIGAAVIQEGGYVGLFGSNWRANSIVNHGTLELSDARLLPADGGTFNLLDNGGLLRVHERTTIGGYTGAGLISMQEVSANLEFLGPVRRVQGSHIDAGLSYSKDPKVVYRGQTVFDLRDADISDFAKIGFAETAVVTLELGPGGVSGTAHQLAGEFGLIFGGRLQLDFGTGKPLAAGESALQLHPGLTLDVFDTHPLLIVGSFASVSLLNATLAPGAVLDLSSLYTDGVVRVVQAAAVPEPGTWALWLSGLAGLGWQQARRRARQPVVTRQSLTPTAP